MSNFFSRYVGAHGIGSASLQIVFDGELQTPDLIDEIAKKVPTIRDALAGLRESMPLVPDCKVGSHGPFERLPNHYRSVNFELPSGSESPESTSGVIVFKGTEPLIEDFPSYLEWMLSVTFRGNPNPMPMGLHFPLEVRIPPAAMCIGECIAEQAVSSKIQREYLQRYGRLPRLPVPLFVFKMTPTQMECYENSVRSYLPAEALKKIRRHLADGIGVEVYYYPEVPIRVADLFFMSPPVAFNQEISSAKIETTIARWIALFSEMLCLQYMPYAPWHRGMGSCCDIGNACIDGGFSDLLTLVPFAAIPNSALFRTSLASSINVLSDSVLNYCQASLGLPSRSEPVSLSLVEDYVRQRIREIVMASENEGFPVNAMLTSCLRSPDVPEILRELRKSDEARRRSVQYTGTSTSYPSLIEGVM